METSILGVFTSRYRYVFGLVLFVFLLGSSLFLAYNIPGQLSNLEVQSTVQSATMGFIHPSSLQVVDAPYHLLQKASLHFFGLTPFAIKLPSLLIGALTGLGILWLLRCWLLRTSIALFTGVIAITSSQFLTAASNGTPLIMPLFWLVVLLLLALKLSNNHQESLWSLVVGAVFGLSLYTPLSAYFIISLLLAVVLHPHLRYLLRTIPKKNVVYALLVGLIVSLPLIYSAIKHTAIATTLIGWPGSQGIFGQIRFNIIELAKAYFFVWQPNLTILGATPFFGLGTLCLMAFGRLKLLTHHHAARSYSLAILLPVTAVLIILQPQYAIILFMPAMLLLGIGIEGLLEEWYKLFPHNPYARVVALMPVLILLTGIIITNVTYFTAAYRYNPELSRYYTQDLALIRPLVKKYPNAVIVAPYNQQPFYNLLRREFPAIQTTQELGIITLHQPIIITTGTGAQTNNLGPAKAIVTDSYRAHTPRFYVYVPR